MPAAKVAPVVATTPGGGANKQVGGFVLLLPDS